VPIDELKDALRNEYRRRIIHYKMVDEAMKKKHGVSFQRFETRNFVKEQGFSWQVESDAMDWEHALGRESRSCRPFSFKRTGM